jgi:uncharacterized protein with PIN domain
LGFDTIYSKEINPGSLIIEALRGERVVLTRNHRLPQSRGVKIVTIKAETIKEQLEEVLKTIKVRPDPQVMFSRCIICNVELVGIEREKISNRVPEYVLRTQEDFTACPNCQRIYWSGTHWGNVAKTLAGIKL